MTERVQADQLRITVEMGDEYDPSDRIAAALAELAEALADDNDDDDDEVAGFGFEPVRSFTFNSLSASSVPSISLPKAEGQWIDTASSASGGTGYYEGTVATGG